jgi:hypothetical protein
LNVWVAALSVVVTTSTGCLAVSPDVKAAAEVEAPPLRANP